MVPRPGSDPDENPDLPFAVKLRLLLSYVTPHRRILVLGILLGLVGTAMELATPLVTKAVLDGLSVDASLRGPVTLLVVLLVAGTVIGLVQGIMLGTLAERIILSARTGMIRHLLGARIPDLAARSGGEMVARVTSDTVLIRDATTTTIVQGINGIIAVIGAVVLMAVLDLPLLLVTGVMVIVVGVASAMLMPALARAQLQAQAELGKLGGRLDGVLRALRTVKAGRAQERESDRIGAYAQESARKAIRAVRLENVAWAITGAGVNAAVVVILGLGAWRVAAGEMVVSTLVAFLLYLFQLMMPIMMLTMAMTALQSGLAAAARIHQISSLPQESDDPALNGRADPDTPVADSPYVLEMRDVTFRYRSDQSVVLDGVSLEVPRIGHTAIVGPSGAGKTTVFGLVLKFLAPESGEILFDARPFDTWPLGDLRRRIAYVEQDTPVVPGTIRDNVAYANPAAADDAVWSVLETVRLADRIASMPQGLDTDVTGAVLSGGERQRIAVARALLAEASVMLLDEVTAQLDAVTELAVARGIREQARRGAVITIAHRLSTVMDADRIFVLEAGRVRAVGRHNELLAGDRLYAELVAALRIGDSGIPKP